MDSVIIDAGTLEFSEADLTATGLLIPFGVECRSNIGQFTYEPGVLDLPTDLTGMALNVEHKREDVVGGFQRVWQAEQGVMATFKYRDTPAGRAAFQDGKDGKRQHLSAEVANVRIRAGKALPGGTLFAAAQVERPAFAGATLLAAEDTPDDGQPAKTESRYVTEYTDPDGATWRRVEATQTETVETDSGTETTVTTTVTETTDATPAEEDTEGETTLTATAVDPAPTVTVPATLLASAPKGKAKDMKPEEIDLGTIFASIAAIKNQDAGAIEDARTLLAALADIKYEAAGGLTTAGSGILQPAWVGKLWQGRRYQRKWLDLCTHLYGGIQLGGRKGFTIAAGAELVQPWAGNKADIPSGGATTATKGSTRRQYGWGADIAREWFDLDGGADVIEELFKLVADSYARVTDKDALTDIFAAASRTSTALDRLVAPGGLPAGTPANSQYYPAAQMLIQAIEAVNDADDTPSFAVVNPVAWAQLVYTPKDLLPEFVSLSVGVGTGEATVGGVKVVKAPQSFFAGTTAANPQVLAGAKGAIEFREQGQTPIQIDALDIARGGVDRAVVGYMETFVVRPESLVLIGTKP